jgi:hypothetical protein
MKALCKGKKDIVFSCKPYRFVKEVHIYYMQEIIALQPAERLEYLKRFLGDE